MSEIKALLIQAKLAIAPLYVDDAFMSSMVLGDHIKGWPEIRKMLQREGMPPVRRSMGGLYYLPAQLRFFDAREGIATRDAVSYPEDGPADFSR